MRPTLAVQARADMTRYQSRQTLVVKEAALHKSFARAKFSNVVHHLDNGSRASLSYGEAAGIKAYPFMGHHNKNTWTNE